MVAATRLINQQRAPISFFALSKEMEIDWQNHTFVNLAPLIALEIDRQRRSMSLIRTPKTSMYNLESYCNFPTRIAALSSLRKRLFKRKMDCTKLWLRIWPAERNSRQSSISGAAIGHDAWKMVPIGPQNAYIVGWRDELIDSASDDLSYLGRCLRKTY